MAVTTGNSGVVKFSTVGGTLGAIGEVRSFSIEESADTVETTAMGDTFRKYLKTFTTGTVSVDALFDNDTSASGQDDFDVGASLVFDIYPTGETTGESYSGTGIVTSKSVTASYDGLVEASYQLQITTAVAVG
jgi:hypothetical protein